jgi:hypothetical protein
MGEHEVLIVRAPPFVEDFFVQLTREEDEFNWLSYKCKGCAWVWPYTTMAQGHPALFMRLAEHLVDEHRLVPVTFSNTSAASKTTRRS